MKLPTWPSLLLLLPLTSTIACEADQPIATENGSRESAWNDANDPEQMGQGYEENWFELNTAELREARPEQVPWTGSYWPMIADGYNARWQGAQVLSPVEAYDYAFNHWRPTGTLAEFLTLTKFSEPGVPYSSQYYEEIGPATAWAHGEGNIRARNMTGPDGSPYWDAQSTDVEKSSWGGLEGWFGHCHAWAPAAMTSLSPLYGVTHNGVNFTVSDIKALINATFEKGRSMFLGGRCNRSDVPRDEYGRIIDDECRDTNAGAFHIVTLNRVGIRNASFVIDVDEGAAVWNQPVVGYTILRQDEISLESALGALGRGGEAEYPYNPNAARFVHVEMQLDYVYEDTQQTYAQDINSFIRGIRYEYILELDDDGDIVGGEWLSNQPDFLWAPYGKGQDAVDENGKVVIKHSDVQTLLKLSREEVQWQVTVNSVDVAALKADGGEWDTAVLAEPLADVYAVGMLIESDEYYDWMFEVGKWSTEKQDNRTSANWNEVVETYSESALVRHPMRIDIRDADGLGLFDTVGEFWVYVSDADLQAGSMTIADPFSGQATNLVLSFRKE